MAPRGNLGRVCNTPGFDNNIRWRNGAPYHPLDIKFKLHNKSKRYIKWLWARPLWEMSVGVCVCAFVRIEVTLASQGHTHTCTYRGCHLGHV